MSRDKQSFEKKGLKLNDPKDVERKRLEQRVIRKIGDERLQRLSKNSDFIDYMYELIELTGYFNAEEPNNSEVYIKKGRRQIACKIFDDLSQKTDDGDLKIIAMRKASMKKQLEAMQMAQAETNLKKENKNE